MLDIANSYIPITQRLQRLQLLLPLGTTLTDALLDTGIEACLPLGLGHLVVDLDL